MPLSRPYRVSGFGGQTTIPALYLLSSGFGLVSLNSASERKGQSQPEMGAAALLLCMVGWLRLRPLSKTRTLIFVFGSRKVHLWHHQIQFAFFYHLDLASSVGIENPFHVDGFRGEAKYEHVLVLSGSVYGETTSCELFLSEGEGLGYVCCLTPEGSVLIRLETSELSFGLSRVVCVVPLVTSSVTPPPRKKNKKQQENNKTSWG